MSANLIKVEKNRSGELIRTNAQRPTEMLARATTCRLMTTPFGGNYMITHFVKGQIR